MHWMEMKPEKCTREACLRALLRVLQARVSQVIQTRANGINSIGKAQTKDKKNPKRNSRSPHPEWNAFPIHFVQGNFKINAHVFRTFFKVWRH